MRTLVIAPSNSRNNTDRQFSLLDLETGELLYQHFCSNPSWAPGDLYYRRPDRMEEMQKRFGQVEIKFINETSVSEEELERRNHALSQYGDRKGEDWRDLTKEPESVEHATVIDDCEHLLDPDNFIICDGCGVHMCPICNEGASRCHDCKVADKEDEKISFVVDVPKDVYDAYWKAADALWQAKYELNIIKHKIAKVIRSDLTPRNIGHDAYRNIICTPAQ